MQNISGAILAGGKATRLDGIEKGLLKIKGETIIEHTLRMLKPLVDEVFIITNDSKPYSFLNIPIFPDKMPGLGPLQGIATALSQSSYKRTFIVPCDMPFITEPSIQTLITYDQEAEVIIPRSQKGFEPLFAIYSISCLPKILETLRSKKRRVIDIIPKIKTAFVPSDFFEDSLWCNINKPDDLDKIKAYLSGSNKKQCYFDITKYKFSLQNGGLTSLCTE